jgi:3-dehydroquinate dehydratase/shikimate dehydrogenase
MLIATLPDPENSDVGVAAGAASQHADLLEIRLDLLPEERRARLAGIAAGLPRPWIATCRRRSDGGSFEGSEEERLALLRRGAAAGAAWIDVEHGSAAGALIGKVPGVRFVLSHHDLQAFPADLAGLVRQMAMTPGVALLKVAVQADDIRDNLAIRDLLASRPTPIPLAAFCLGEAGQISRIMALAWGSAATYGCAGRAALAPGQIPVADLDRSYRVRAISTDTVMVGLLGWPLGHSLSPRVHNAAFAALDLDFVYLPVASPALGPACGLAAELPLHALSVTRPYKEAVVAELDDLEPLARRIGAVNTVLCDGGRRFGLNTDASGGITPLRTRLDLAGLPVAVVGAGGAARALTAALSDEGARVRVFGRSPERVESMAHDLGVESAPLAALATEPYRLLVHATPVGQSPGVSDLPFPAEWLRGDLIYDLVYTPRPTRLLREAASRGLQTLDGLEMFLAQAAEQFHLFTDREAPLAAMRQAALAALDAGSAGRLAAEGESVG